MVDGVVTGEVKKDIRRGSGRGRRTWAGVPDGSNGSKRVVMVGENAMMKIRAKVAEERRGSNEGIGGGKGA